NDVERLRLGNISGVSPGDTFVVRNLRSGEAGCGYVTDAGAVRAELACDLGDPLEVAVYAGRALLPEPDCPLADDATVIGTLDAFEETLDFQGALYEAGEPLVSVAEGLGKKRATPGLRRFLTLAQHVLDPADPGVLMEFMQRRPLTYAGTGQTTGAHVMNMTTLGDMNVPASGGINQSRSAGLVDFLTIDERWGKTPNQMLIETAVFEAVHVLGRYHDTSGNPVHLDVANYSDGKDPRFDTIPRLDPPAHLWQEDVFCSDEPPYDKLPCGISGVALPLSNVTGQHGFDWPGIWQDEGLENCQAACTEEVTDDNGVPCDCADLEVFDMGHFIFNVLGNYFASEGTEWDTRVCNSRDDCEYLPAPPAWRDEPDSEAYDPDALR
ncbi:MAG: hypothetical protein VX938_04630, partial [Myxococcota bacterium]|nr:hypothetical protein [Myxococcota bacterium]